MDRWISHAHRKRNKRERSGMHRCSLVFCLLVTLYSCLVSALSLFVQLPSITFCIERHCVLLSSSTAASSGFRLRWRPFEPGCVHQKKTTPRNSPSPCCPRWSPPPTSSAGRLKPNLRLPLSRTGTARNRGCRRRSCCVDCPVVRRQSKPYGVPGQRCGVPRNSRAGRVG